MPVWMKSLDLSRRVFDLTISLPRSEDYGLTSQIRRSSNSVSANIAEAFGRMTQKDKKVFYIYSRGSAFETKSLYGISVKYFNEKDSNSIMMGYEELIFELNKIIKKLKDSQP